MGYDISYDRLVGWEADLRLLTERVAGSLFTRPEPRATFTDLVLKEHERSMVDFSALAGNATDPDLRALLAGRAVLMEQTHLAQARMIAGAIAKADSARQDSLKSLRRGGRP